jgi:hypothetical protein
VNGAPKNRRVIRVWCPDHFYAMVDGRFRTKSIISHQIVIKGQSSGKKLQLKKSRNKPMNPNQKHDRSPSTTRTP